MISIQYAILASGGLGTVCTEIIVQQQQVSFVMTDKNSIAIIELCRQKNIPCFVGNPRKGKATAFLSDLNTDVILSINYLFIVENDIISLPTKYAINLHGSLLPRYRGRTPHVWAIINNEKETGITAHLMTEGCDEGDIVYQEKIDIRPEETGAGILGIFNEQYPLIVQRLMNMITNNQIQPQSQEHSKATYFEKRTPDDGGINWDWQKERIYNWVRAQAKPYPGAFAFKGADKITINQLNYSDQGYHNDMPNGLVLKNGKQPIVKTPNGAVILTDFVLPDGVTLLEGDILK
jgi:methionyl-tRNA formyltransferase